MRAKVQKFLPVLGLIAAAALGGGALWLDEGIPASLYALMCGFAGMLLGLSVTAIAMHRIQRRWTPDQRRQAKLSENDERSVTIRDKAAKDSWYCSLALLWGLMVVTLFLHQITYIVLSSAAVVLHCVFYLVNINRWSKKI